MKLHPLICPKCGNPVDGHDRDSIFVCKGCKLSFNIKTKEQFAVKLLKPLIKENPAMFLPFWYFNVEPDLTSNDPKKINQYKAGTIPSSLTYPAFLFLRYTYFENLPILLGRKFSECEEFGSISKLAGGRRDHSTVKSQIQYTILSYLDRIADIKGVTLKINIMETLYIGVPFSSPSGGKIKELITGATFPLSTIPDLII